MRAAIMSHDQQSEKERPRNGEAWKADRARVRRNKSRKLNLAGLTETAPWWLIVLSLIGALVVWKALSYAGCEALGNDTYTCKHVKYDE